MGKYWAYTKANLQNTFAFRGSMFIWLMGDIVRFATMALIWQSASAGELIAGYRRSELAAYYLASFCLQWIILWYPFGYIFQQIKDGEIVLTTLSKPISSFWSCFFTEIGWHTVSSLVGLIISSVVAYILKDSLLISFSFNSLLLTLLAIVLGIFVTFVFSLNMAYLAFWFTEVGAIESFFWMGRSIFGGGMLPITFLPGFWKNLAEFLPFRYLFSFPLEIFFRKIDNYQILIGFLMGGFWFLILYWINKQMWEKGRKVYSAFGQ